MPKTFTETYTSYLPAEDVTIVWQDIFITDGKTTDCIQHALVGWYCGEPDEHATAQYGISTLNANYVDCDN